jgi:hypothetical protein
MPLPKPKSPGRIQIWRDEVACAHFTPSESEYLAPPIQQPSFWRKILKRDPKIPGSGSTSRFKIQGDGKDSVKTEMYDPEDKEGDAGLRVPEQEAELGREGSMENWSGESELGGLRQRRERLERAARLLNRDGRGKEINDRKKGGG